MGSSSGKAHPRPWTEVQKLSCQFFIENVRWRSVLKQGIWEEFVIEIYTSNLQEQRRKSWQGLTKRQLSTSARDRSQQHPFEPNSGLSRRILPIDFRARKGQKKSQGKKEEQAWTGSRRRVTVSSLATTELDSFDLEGVPEATLWTLPKPNQHFEDGLQKVFCCDGPNVQKRRSEESLFNFLTTPPLKLDNLIFLLWFNSFSNLKGWMTSTFKTEQREESMSKVAVSNSCN